MSDRTECHQGGPPAPRARPLVQFLLLAAVCAASPRAAGAELPLLARLNLLVITADDLNADSAGWMGNTLPATPRLDVLAAGAHRFVNAHVTAPICQPSRAALMTGRVPHRSGALGFDPIAADVPTLVEVLRAEGYFAAAVNKLEHMQPPWKFPWDLGLSGSGKDPARLRADVERCLEAAARQGKPFFLNVNIEDPHRPFRGGPHPRRGAATLGAGPPPSILGGMPFSADTVPVPGFLEDLRAVREELARYYASVTRLDASVGQVLDAIEAAGHERDTVVVVLSDNGMSFPFAKATVYRHGTWSPVVVRHPAIPGPVDHDELVSSVDVMPTLLELLDVARPAGMDGRSWGPLLRGEMQEGRDFVVTHVNTVRSGRSFPQRCVRTRTGALLFQPWADGRTRFRAEPTRGPSFRALVRAAGIDAGVAARLRQLVHGVPLAFYDLEHDPAERRNLLHAAEFQSEIERLQALLLTHMEQSGDPLGESFRRAIAEWRRRRVLHGDESQPDEKSHASG